MYRKQIIGLGIVGLAIGAWIVVSDYLHKDFPKNKTSIIQTTAKLPLYFETNQGQVKSGIQFIGRGIGYGAYFTAKEIGMSFDSSKKGDNHSSFLTMKLLGGHAKRIYGEGMLEGKSHYLQGADSTKWVKDVRQYTKVRYEELYPDIDLVFYGSQGKLEYDYVIQKKADVSQIALQIEGAEKIQLNKEGDLLVKMQGGEELVQKAPKIYQELDNNKKMVRGRYVLKGQNRIGFEVAAYDKTYPLIIDPVLEYGTYLGGNAEDRGYALAIDSSKNIYVSGLTHSANFHNLSAYQTNSAGGADVFITKFNSVGNGLVYSTYLGGNGDDSASDIVVDSDGNLYITGQTNSVNFPTQNAYDASLTGASDAFITKLNSSGNGLIYSTYLGGSNGENGFSIAIDNDRNIYVSGETTSNNFPTQNAYQGMLKGTEDSYIVKLHANGNSLIYATYLGGSGYDGQPRLTVDSNKNVYVTGTTNSTDFPSTQNSYQQNISGIDDAFVTKFNATGTTLIYSTYLGGSNFEQGSSIVVDNNGNAYITGFTTSMDFPTTQNAYQQQIAGIWDAFITKMNQSGTGLVYSTYLGGRNDEHGVGIALNDNGNAYVSGWTTSTNFPTQNALQQNIGSTGGLYDAFVTQLNTAGTALVYSTYLGGNDHDVAVPIVVDENWTAYVAGTTSSTNFPTQNAFQQNLAADRDVFVVKISACSTLPPVSNTCITYECDPVQDQWDSHYTPAGFSCADTNPCNGIETCDGQGICQPGTPITTDDNNACTTDTCDLSTGQVTHVSVPVDDNNACTTDTCNPTTGLISHSPINVDDGNPCTDDGCDPAFGDFHFNRPRGSSCSDGNACTSNDVCDGLPFACRGIAVTPIDDGNICTTDTCDPATGQTVYTSLTGVSCSDGNVCNGEEVCEDGECKEGRSMPEMGSFCDDNDMCTSCNGGYQAGADCCREGMCLGKKLEDCKPNPK